jgi:MFS family permease
MASLYSDDVPTGGRALPQRTRVLYTFGYLCVEWTVGAAMGCMVGGPALLAIAQQIDTVRIVAPPTEECVRTGLSPCYDTTDIGDMGLATTALAIGNLLGSAVGGPLVDSMVKWNRVIVCVVFLNGASIAAVPYATQLWHLIAASLVNGFAIGIIEPMLNVGCVRLWPPERSGPLMQTFATTFGSGIFSSPAIVALDLASTGSFHSSYTLIGAMVCVTAIAPVLIPSPQAAAAVTAWVVRDRQGEDGEEVEEEEDDGENARLVQSSDKEQSHAEEEEARTMAMAGGGSQQRSRTELVIKALVAFVVMCYCGAEASFGAWIPTYAVAAGSSGYVTANLAPCSPLASGATRTFFSWLWL